ncbi:MAG: DUF4292 domain-containing protein [Syntrophales bacterium]|nr:DUF4292 domain-containing protein [Syntrophales bacterium]
MSFITRALHFSLLLVIFCLVSMGCVHREAYPIKPQCSPVPAELTTPIPSPLKGIAICEVSLKGIRIPFHLAVLLKQPASMRIEMLPLIGPPDLILAVKDEEEQLYLPLKGVFYVSKGTIVSRLIGFPISKDELVAYLTGRVPGYLSSYCVKEEISDEGILYDVLTERDDLHFSFWRDKKSKFLTGLVRYDGEKRPLYVVTFSDFRSLGSYVIPFTVSVSDRRGRLFKLSYEELEWVHNDVDDAFIMKIPSGVNPIEVEDGNLPIPTDFGELMHLE